MACRGWMGGPYPIRQAPVENQHAVDVRVMEMLQHWDHSCSELGDVAELIKGLPLLGHRGHFYASTDAAKGLTINDRVEFIRSGESHESIESCMRLSSNWLCASVNRYMTIIGLEAPFDIEQLRNIS
jgi:hypothetical protein